MPPRDKLDLFPRNKGEKRNYPPRNKEEKRDFHPWRSSNLQQISKAQCKTLDGKKPVLLLNSLQVNPWQIYWALLLLKTTYALKVVSVQELREIHDLFWSNCWFGELVLISYFLEGQKLLKRVKIGSLCLPPINPMHPFIYLKNPEKGNKSKKSPLPTNPDFKSRRSTAKKMQCFKENTVYVDFRNVYKTWWKRIEP